MGFTLILCWQEKNGDGGWDNLRFVFEKFPTHAVAEAAGEAAVRLGGSIAGRRVAFEIVS